MDQRVRGDNEWVRDERGERREERLRNEVMAS